MRHTAVLAAFVLAAIAACTSMDTSPIGEGDDVGTTSVAPPPTPRQLFDTTVFPLLQEKCATCHVGASGLDFLGSANTPDSYYKGITGDALVNGGFHASSSNLLSSEGHVGLSWTASDRQVIAAWLDAEMSARGIDM
jgi:hypothetical protein